MKQAPVHLFDMNRQALEGFLEGLDVAPWRASQVLKWLYHQRELKAEGWSNLSKPLRAQIAALTQSELPEVLEERVAKDGVRKFLMRPIGLGKDSAIETVLIPDGNRNTLCVSSQVGCALGCTFCATGMQGFTANLSTADIIGQVWIVAERLRELGCTRGITNVVFMGMGEPLLNFEPVMRAVDLMIDDCGFGLANHRVTISTAGVVPGINDMKGRTSASLAISLHAANDELRSSLVPINRKYKIADLLSSARAYVETLGPRRRLTMEYTLIRNVNDSPAQARELAGLLAEVRCNVNLIPFNPIAGSGFKRPSENSIRAFQRVLLNERCSSIVRRTRGDEINAACGQLVGGLTTSRQQSRRIARRFEAQPVEISADAA